MSESQRILSGSKTKGTRVTSADALKPFDQGINIKDFSTIGDSLRPQIRSGDTLGIFKAGVRMRGTLFDDTITLNNTLDDLREDDDAFEQRIVFDIEKSNFGQPPETPQGEPFADLVDFDPVVFIQDPGVFMFPVNLWNLGELPNHEFDGVMEVFDKRTHILGLVDLRYDGRTTRGALIGSAGERPYGSKEISQTYAINDPSAKSFLDAPDAMTSEEVGSRGPFVKVAFPLQGFQDITETNEGKYVEQDYHDLVYKKIKKHNDNGMINALELLNSSSCQTISNPFEKSAATGFYFGERAGSITFGNSYVPGEYE